MLICNILVPWHFDFHKTTQLNLKISAIQGVLEKQICRHLMLSMLEKFLPQLDLGLHAHLALIRKCTKFGFDLNVYTLYFCNSRILAPYATKIFSTATDANHESPSPYNM